MSKTSHKTNGLDLFALAHQAMIENGFMPDESPAIKAELKALMESPPKADDAAIKDLREVLWSSIDDAKSRDLDQVEFAETRADGNIRLLVAIADVDAFVPKGSAIDAHAAENCTSVYTGIKTFPMLPEELSTDLTSLNANEDRLAIVTELVLSPDGAVLGRDAYRANVKNHARLSYEQIGPWLDGKAPLPDAVKAVAGLEAQLRLQFESAKDLFEVRKQHGAIELGTLQSNAVIDDLGKVTALAIVEPNGARELIANFMIAANVAMAEFLEAKGGASLRRVVRTPKYWSRIVEIARDLGHELPDNPDSRALADFLAIRKRTDPIHFPDLSLAIVKSLGPGEYTVEVPGTPGEGHFGLAVDDYTHSTAPNRRYADLITQRLLKAALTNGQAPYNAEELKAIAERCTQREDAARKVERKMRKVAAAVLMKDKTGEKFEAIVTGVSEKGTFARLLAPPVDGRVMQGESGMRVGEKVTVRLLSADPQRGFIDFARA